MAMSELRHGRTGIWQLMSTHILENPGKTHTVQDDMESFVLVVLYIILQHLPHNHSANLTAIVRNVFDSYTLNDDGTAVGGGEKGRMFISRKWITVDFEVTNNHPLTGWVHFALSAVGQWHKYLEDQLPRKLCDLIDEFESDYQLGPDVSSAPVLLLENMAFKDHEALRKIWNAIIKRTDWPSQHIAMDHFDKSCLSESKSSGKRHQDQGGAGLAGFSNTKKMKSSENAVFVG
ncbi:hypothetical protein Hypma_004737 [Hypsizygus marmoreus]|uniref:Fungal-type protein kinase domain-containing protein n=1 Tax=Hypsizygus marmoreus TaxID=39966 RepID=A0A369J8W1_HYPMA|nr:hypothetical protein Hypma_004737 [Hypsizygus marmoreus]